MTNASHVCMKHFFLDQGLFGGATGAFCFGLRVTFPMGLKQGWLSHLAMILESPLVLHLLFYPIGITL